MLTYFKIRNYKSFVEETTFSMLAAPKQSGFDYSIYKRSKDNSKIICSSVVYGPNASGKSNIIGAMDTLKRIVLRGNIRNATNDEGTPNAAAYNLELVPNSSLIENKPVYFCIDFIEHGDRFKYELEIDLGTFFDEFYDRQIISESLYINGKSYFIRNKNSIEITKSSLFKKFSPLNSESKVVEEIIKSSLNKDELFLTNGLKMITAPLLAKVVLEWFENEFIVIYRADSIKLTGLFENANSKSIYIDKTTNEAAKLFGVESSFLGFMQNEDDAQMSLYSIIRGDSNNGIRLPADVFESYGTVRFVNMFPLILKAINTGSVLVVDEFDASIHPMAILSILSIFHNDEINKKHAQLIFNTHNPIFLNQNVLRRDEIKFVERESDTNFSTLYSLSDFGTSGSQKVRKNSDYMNNYFINRYGAINDVDLSIVFEKSLPEEED